MVHTQESEDPSFSGYGDSSVEVPTSSVPRGIGALVAFSGGRVVVPEEVVAGRVPERDTLYLMIGLVAEREFVDLSENFECSLHVI
ncbi:uncharacterized protein G2W53_022598 [Senna tora]|uniref:Uncharacterized protein n=1 Tax=Senna tora TaxID=362788 RepID=A0A834TN76_9FABA|nr:uncharacterized protein G2W53_022598 [Senna tora]